MERDVGRGEDTPILKSTGSQIIIVAGRGQQVRPKLKEQILCAMGPSTTELAMFPNMTVVRSGGSTLDPRKLLSLKKMESDEQNNADRAYHNIRAGYDALQIVEEHWPSIRATLCREASVLPFYSDVGKMSMTKNILIIFLVMKYLYMLLVFTGNVLVVI